jgi:tetratricopeptide (TPR) repeat protein
MIVLPTVLCRKREDDMAVRVHDTSCRNCGAPAGLGETKCKFCKQPVVISTFNSVYSMPMPMVNQYAATYREALQSEPDAKDLNNSIAFCYLKLKLHDKAFIAFEKAMEDNFDNSETFFYAAICLLKGKKAFLAQRPEIDKIEKYINAALMIESRGIYYYLWAYIKYDYFERKSLNTTPDYREALAQAKASGISQHDIEQLFGILGVSRPEVL